MSIKWSEPGLLPLSGTTQGLSELARDTLELAHTQGLHLEDTLDVIGEYLPWYYAGGPKVPGTPIWTEGETIHGRLTLIHESIMDTLNEEADAAEEETEEYEVPTVDEVPEITQSTKEEDMSKSEVTRALQTEVDGKDIGSIYGYFLGLSPADYNGRRSNTSKMQELIGRSPTPAVEEAAREYYYLIVSTKHGKHGDSAWSSLTSTLDGLLLSVEGPPPSVRTRVSSWFRRGVEALQTTGRDALLGGIVGTMDVISTVEAGIIKQAGTDLGRTTGAFLLAKAEVTKEMQAAYVATHGPSYAAQREERRLIRITEVSQRTLYKDAMMLAKGYRRESQNEDALTRMSEDASGEEAPKS